MSLSRLRSISLVFAGTALFACGATFTDDSASADAVTTSREPISAKALYGEWLSPDGDTKWAFDVAEFAPRPTPPPGVFANPSVPTTKIGHFAKTAGGTRLEGTFELDVTPRRPSAIVFKTEAWDESAGAAVTIATRSTTIDFLPDAMGSGGALMLDGVRFAGATPRFGTRDIVTSDAPWIEQSGQTLAMMGVASGGGGTDIPVAPSVNGTYAMSYNGATESGTFTFQQESGTSNYFLQLAETGAPPSFENVVFYTASELWFSSKRSDGSVVTSFFHR